jgi:hypothetical protein
MIQPRNPSTPTPEDPRQKEPMQDPPVDPEHDIDQDDPPNPSPDQVVFDANKTER